MLRLETKDYVYYFCSHCKSRLLGIFGYDRPFLVCPFLRDFEKDYQHDIKELRLPKTSQEAKVHFAKNRKYYAEMAERLKR